MHLNLASRERHPNCSHVAISIMHDTHTHTHTHTLFITIRNHLLEYHLAHIVYQSKNAVFFCAQIDSACLDVDARVECWWWGAVGRRHPAAAARHARLSAGASQVCTPIHRSFSPADWPLPPDRPRQEVRPLPARVCWNWCVRGNATTNVSDRPPRRRINQEQEGWRGWTSDESEERRRRMTHRRPGAGRWQFYDWRPGGGAVASLLIQTFKRRSVDVFARQFVGLDRTLLGLENIEQLFSCYQTHDRWWSFESN